METTLFNNAHSTRSDKFAKPNLFVVQIPTVPCTDGPGIQNVYHLVSLEPLCLGGQPCQTDGPKLKSIDWLKKQKQFMVRI